jgi:hypothetical protein
MGAVTTRLNLLKYSLLMVKENYVRPYQQVTVAPLSEAWIVLNRSNIAVVGSNPTPGLDVYVRSLCVCAVLCEGSGLPTGLSPFK